VTTIRASCPSCGDVELTIRDVTVRVSAIDARGSYAFRCPSCAIYVTKPADERIVELLLSAGVDQEDWHVPAEMLEPRHGSAITYDDLLDFHAQLQQPGWFDQLLTFDQN
jgi:hypothetical protein